MKTYHPGCHLLVEQRGPVLDLLDSLAAPNFSRQELSSPRNFTVILEVMATDEALVAGLNECAELVRWDRCRGYALAYLLQCVTAQGSPLHARAAMRFSNAQITCGEDMALHSAEVAWRTATLQAPRLAEAERVRLLGDAEEGLRMQHRFYSTHLRNFDYLEASPLVDHLYDWCVIDSLRAAYPATLRYLSGLTSTDMAEAYLRAASEASHADDAYHWITARRMAAVYASVAKDYSTAEVLYRETLRDAQELGLEGEIGHLLRQHGWVLKMLGFPAAAAREQRLALEHEQPRHLLTYWAALSARELGDALSDVTRLLQRDMDESVEVKDVAVLLPKVEAIQHTRSQACDAYARGRKLLDAVCASSRLPATAAVTRQMVRSSSDNAIAAGLGARRDVDVLAEIEALSPRSVASALAELHAAKSLPGGSDTATFLKEREIFHQHLTTIPEDFSDYIAALAGQYDSRRRFLEARDQLPVVFRGCDDVATQLLSLCGHVDAVVLAFFIGPRPSCRAVAIDLADGALRDAQLGSIETDLCHAYDAFVLSLERMAVVAGTPSITVIASDAVNEFVGQIDLLLAPAMELVAGVAAGRPLIIVPQVQLHAVPWGALTCGGSRLLNAVSSVATAPSFEVLLKGNLTDSRAVVRDPLVVLRASKGTPFFDGTITELRRSRTLRVFSDPAPADAIEALNAATGDVLFACHGSFDLAAPGSSRLRLPDEPGLSVADVSSALRAIRPRSVTMGACDSGRVRSSLPSEYLGLNATLVAAGAQNVIASLWKVNMLAAAIVLAEVLKAESDVSIPAALSAAQRRLARLSRDEVLAWVHMNAPELDVPTSTALERTDHPFAEPYFWAAFSASGPQLQATGLSGGSNP